MSVHQIGNKFYPGHNGFLAHDSLPLGNYTLEETKNDGIFLAHSNSFSFPAKTYNFNQDFISLVLRSFENGDRNLGVLLSGEKGSGKSITAKQLATAANIPVININKKIPESTDFVQFLSSFSGNLVVYIDEFEKLFSVKESAYHSQLSLLNFFDSLYSNNKILFILTTNGPINELFMNRPSRIKFVKNFHTMEMSMIEKIAQEEIINKDFIPDFLNHVSIHFNLDMVLSIIREINSLNMPFSSFLSVYNCQPPKKSYTIYMNLTEDDDEEEFNKEKIVTFENSKYVRTYIYTSEILNIYSSSFGDYIYRFHFKQCLSSENGRMEFSCPYKENRKYIIIESEQPNYRKSVGYGE